MGNGGGGGEGGVGDRQCRGRKRGNHLAETNREEEEEEGSLWAAVSRGHTYTNSVASTKMPQLIKYNV